MRQVLLLLRGAVYPRQRTQPHFKFGARRSPPDGRSGLYGNSAARAECEFVQRFGREEFGQKNIRGIAGSGGRDSRDSAREIYHIASPGFRKRHYRCYRFRSGALRPRAFAGTERIDARARCHAAAVFARAISRADFVDESGAAGDQHHK